jgi:hypothetical protein
MPDLLAGHFKHWKERASRCALPANEGKVAGVSLNLAFCRVKPKGRNEGSRRSQYPGVSDQPHLTPMLSLPLPGAVDAPPTSLNRPQVSSGKVLTFVGFSLALPCVRLFG